MMVEDAPACLKRKNLRKLWACIELGLIRAHNTRSGTVIEVRDVSDAYIARQLSRVPTGLVFSMKAPQCMSFFAHQVVALTKLKLPESGNHIGFRDGDCYNISPKNLYWR